MGRVKGLIKCSGRPIFYFIRENWGEGSGRILDVDGQDEWGEGLRNWTIFMNVICV